MDVLPGSLRLASICLTVGGCLFHDPGVPAFDSQAEVSTYAESETSGASGPTGEPTTDGPTTSGPSTGGPSTGGPTTAEPTTGEPAEDCGWEERSPPHVPPGRIDATLTLVEEYNVVVLYGGRVGLAGADLEDLWVFDGNDWMKIGTEGSPGPRRGHAVAYDSTRKRLVLHGGERGGLMTMFADRTWVLDQTKWSDLGGGGPSPRAHAAMVDMPNRQRVVLFGGRTKDGPDRGTWLWDGKMWLDTQIQDGPSPRFDHAMAFDEASGKVLLHGGCGDLLCAMPLRDTWAFDGEAWGKVGDGETPGPRSGGMAYDRQQPAMMRFGEGQGYRWIDSKWSAAGAAPDARSGFAIAYHPPSEGIVLFGGLDATLIQSDATRVYRCRP